MKIKDMPKAVGEIDIKAEHIKAGAKKVGVIIFWLILIGIVIIFILVSVGDLKW